MPWKVFETGTDDKKFCVHKLNDDGSMSEKVACHATMDAAKEQMQALYANMPEGEKRAKAITKKEADGEHPSSHYLVVEDPEEVSTWHLRVRGVDGELNHRLMGAAFAALHEGYRGNKYEGPNKEQAISKLRKLYEQEDMLIPGEGSKAMSLTEQVRDIENAWYQQHPIQPQLMVEGGWITEVFEDYAIACVDGKYYRVPFTVAENEIMFAPMTEWVEVEEQKEWIEKSKKLKLKSHSMRVKVAVGKKHIIRRSTTIEETTKRAKAFDEYSEDAVFNVLGVPFGGHLEGRDREGEAFTKSTDTWLNVGDSVPCTYYHGFGPDDPEEVQDPPVIIGRAKFTGSDKRGHWFDTRLDPDEPLAARLLEDGAELRASTGAVSHLVRMKAGGLIAVWPVAELALFDVNDWRQPANDLAVVERKITQEPEGAAEADGAKGAPRQSVVIPNRTIQKRALQLLAKISVEG